jgi:PAS domain S-box-containing protein
MLAIDDDGSRFRSTARSDAEDELQKQAELLRVTIACSGDGVINTDADNRIRFMNDVAATLTGWTPAGADGQLLASVFHIVSERTRLPVGTSMARVFTDAGAAGLVTAAILIAKDGAERPIEYGAAPIRGEEGRVCGNVVIFRDTTDKRNLDRAWRTSEARNAAILQTAIDCVITMDHERKVVELNSAAERTFGYPGRDIIGRQVVGSIFPSIVIDQQYAGMAHFLATGQGAVFDQRLEFPALRADGSSFPAELTITRNDSAEQPLFTMYLQDISERRRIEQSRNTRLAVTQILGQANSIAEAATAVLQAVCENLNWDIGVFRVFDAECRTVTNEVRWPALEIPAQAPSAINEDVTFRPGVGHVGQLWSIGTPSRMPEESRDSSLKRSAATDPGLHRSIVSPIVVADRTLGVIEFFGRGIDNADLDLVELIGTVSGSLGQFIERRQAAERLQRSELELADFFENAAIGLHWVGPDGTILRANRAELDLLGYRPNEYIGQHIARFHADQDTIRDILQRLQANEVLRDYPARLLCKDGSIRDVLIHSSVFLEEGRFVHTRCFTRDVTDRNRAEAKVREQERQTRIILESITDAVCTFDLDWRFAFLNHRAETLLGRNREELLDKNLWQEYADTLGTELERNFRHAMAEKTTIEFEFYCSAQDRWYELNACHSPDGLSVYFRDASQKRRVEVALRENEEQLQMLANTIPQMAWMAHPDGQIFWYNRRWYDYTGTRFEDMKGWGWERVHDPNVLPKVLERWKSSIETGEPFDMAFPLRGRDGVFRQFLTRVAPLKDDEGHVVRWFGSNTDISEAKRYEDELLEARSRLESTLAAGEIGTWEFDLVNNVVRADRNLARMFGVSPEDAVSGPLEAYTKVIHPEDRDRVAALLQRAIENGDNFESEYRIVGRDQSTRWVVARGRVDRDDTGKPLRLPGVVVDITQRKTAEDQLRASEGQRMLALDSAELGAWSIDSGTNTLSTDERFQIIFSGEIGPIDFERAFALIHSDDRDRVRQAVSAAMQPEDPASYAEEYQVVHPTGGVVRWVLGKGRANFVGEGEQRRLVSFDGTVADITDRKKMENDLRRLAANLSEADHRKDEFLATLAHELRNPLAPIRNGLQVMKLVTDDREALEETRSMMQRQVTQLVRLVDDLMDVSRINSGKLELRKNRLDLATVVRSAVETSRPLIAQMCHRLTIQLPDEPILIDADATRLPQVFLNLLNNAAKYSDAGGHIALDAEVAGSEVVVTVRDTGIGIPHDKLASVFEMFSQVDRSLEKSQGGLGI